MICPSQHNIDLTCLEGVLLVDGAGDILNNNIFNLEVK